MSQKTGHELVGKTIITIDEQIGPVDAVLYYDGENNVYRLTVDLAYISDFYIDPATKNVHSRRINSKYPIAPLSEWVCDTIAAHLGGSPLKAQ